MTLLKQTKVYMVPNKHKVPQKLWKGFKDGQAVYNEVYSSAKRQAIIDPNSAGCTQKQWDVIRHNFACLAAWAVRDLK